MGAAPYVPLKVQSAYSMRESLVRLPAMLDVARAMSLPALALTDRDNLFGAVSFTEIATGGEVRPLLGAMLTVAGEQTLTLLIATPEGHRNLCRLIQKRHLDGPPVLEVVADHAAGLIALTGGAEGILIGRDERAERRQVALLREAFGDRLYMEAPEPSDAWRAIAHAHGLPAVAAAPVRYLRPEDAETWRVAQLGWKRYPPAVFAHHLPTPEEQARRWAGWPEALARTLEIAERCRFTLPLGAHHLPRYPDEPEPSAKLAELCEAGLAHRYGHPAPREARDRLAMELGVIRGMGFCDYFLILWDVVAWCRRNGIAVGPGVGSGAGSLVAYLLGLTDVCPLALDLAFERFLNPERRELPDIDLGLCWRRRDEAIAYVYARYGEEKVARLAAINKLGSRAAIRLTGAGLGLDEELIGAVAKSSGRSSLAKEMELSPGLRAYPWHEEPFRTWLTAAQAVEGLPDHVSMHSCGLVVTPGPLSDHVPVMRAADGTVLAQADKDTVIAYGLLKMDLLSNRALTVLADTAAMVSAELGWDLDPDTLPLDDPAAFALLRTGMAYGLNQLESSGVQGLLRQFAPQNLEDMTAITSLYRPGPIEGGIRDKYIARRHGKERITYPDPCLEPILRGTFGTVLFQEQAMRVAVTFAGFSLGEADLLRRAIAKLRRGDMESLRQRFYEGARALGRPEQVIDEVFGLLAKFAGYGFVKGHAAASQVLAIRQAYLKARWPIHFQAAVLSTGQGYYQPRVYIEDAVRCGAVLVGPCVNRSKVGYTVEQGKLLRVGLAFVSGVGQASAERVVRARGDRPFTSLADLLARGNLDREALTNLITVGALDVFNMPRPALVWQLKTDRRRPTKAQAALQPALLAVDEPSLEVHWCSRDYDEATRRRHEEALLGFRVTPLALPEVPGTVPLGAVRMLKAGTRVRVVAEIVHADRRRTKAGKGLLAGMRLSDGHEHVDAILFPRAFEREFRHLVWNIPLLFEGMVGVSDGEPQLEVTAIATPGRPERGDGGSGG